MYAWLDSGEGGVHWSPLWAPRSWTSASGLARRRRSMPGARVHERGAHSGLLWTSLHLSPVQHTWAACVTRYQFLCEMHFLKRAFQNFAFRWPILLAPIRVILVFSSSQSLSTISCFPKFQSVRSPSLNVYFYFAFSRGSRAGNVKDNVWFKNVKSHVNLFTCWRCPLGEHNSVWSRVWTASPTYALSWATLRTQIARVAWLS